MRGLNRVWDKLIVKLELSIDAKWKVFNAVIRSVATYGGKIWGYRVFD